MSWSYDYSMNNVKEKLGFGKYRECTLEWVIINDRGYLKWMVEQSSKSFTKNLIEFINKIETASNRKGAFEIEYKKYLERQETQQKRRTDINNNQERTRKKRQSVKIYKQDIVDKMKDNSLYDDTVAGRIEWTWDTARSGGEKRTSYLLKQKKYSFVMKKIEYRNREAKLCKRYEMSIEMDGTKEEISERGDCISKFIEKLGLEIEKKKNKKDVNPFDGNQVHFNLQKIIGEALEVKFVSVIVRNNNFFCFKKHDVQDVYIRVPIVLADGRIQRYIVSGGYCENCNVFFITEDTFKGLRKYGIISCKVVTQEAFLNELHRDWNISGDLQSTGPLKMIGYSVGISNALTDVQRQRILEIAVDNGILQKCRIVEYLNWFIKIHECHSNMDAAIEAWNRDRAHIMTYEPGSKPLEVQAEDIVLKRTYNSAYL